MILVDLPRDVVLRPGWWAVSPGVPKRERPTTQERAQVPEGVEAQEVRRLLQWHDAGAGYDAWLRVGMAVHHESRGADWGLELWDEWSSGEAGAAKYPGREALEAKWATFGRDASGSMVTMNWLRGEAERASGGAALDDGSFEVVGSALDSVARRPPGGAEAPTPPERRGVPTAQHLCTDQANAERLVKAYGSRVLVAAGRWHVWDGRRWKADEGDVYRFACRLSDMIKEEARGVVAKAVALGDLEKRKEAEKTAEALVKWSVRSEMRATIEAAVGLARKMLTVGVEWLDADPWLLNCLNGVVDLRTGVLREHRASDLMTRLVEVEYRGDAVCAEWERVVAEIAGGDLGLAGFLRRWFGYCLTGLTWEQVFVIHWGDGGNGKSLVLELMARTMGDYCGIAAPSLVAGKGDAGDRHPTEVAALRGRRMVTAHETGEGAVLREDFVKRATGDEMMTARFMREDFFEFKPTHKLQLLTNPKPVVKGQDRGIWRRVLLVPYGVTFGSAEDVAAGRAHRVKDMGLLGRLSEAEALRGILAWRVRGAIEWARDGLRPPDAVREASARYQAESDRVRQWAVECCEFGGGTGGDSWFEPLTLGLSGVYPCYTSWCRDAGYHPLGRNRFLEELTRSFPILRVEDGYGRGESGNRRKITRVVGLRLLPE